MQIMRKYCFNGTPTTFQIINSYFAMIVMFSSFLILSGFKSKQWKIEKDRERNMENACFIQIP